MERELLSIDSVIFRTPMNGIIRMTELTLDSDLNRSQRETLLLVHSLTRSLLSLMTLTLNQNLWT
jgi:osomolarity two-component system sensor histidine kinase NIK1